MSKRTLRIGCVPEHFSTVFALGSENGHFQRRGIEVNVVFCPGGTGEMTRRLVEGEIDVAAALTEGLVASIANGENRFKICGTHVESPLCWAISTGANSSLRSVEDLRGARIGVSRFGSGSHIIPFVLADQAGWRSAGEANKEYGADTGSLFAFEVLKNFQGLRDGVNSGKADAFLWEKFMTKAYHDNGEVRYIGDITPPWPAFLFAVRTDVLACDAEAVRNFLDAVGDACEELTRGGAGFAVRLVQKFMQSADGVDHNDKVVLAENDICDWFSTVRYPRDCSVVSKAALENCVRTLKSTGLIGETVPDFATLCDERVAKLA